MDLEKCSEEELADLKRRIVRVDFMPSEVMDAFGD